MEKRINIDRFWKVGKKNSNSFTVAGRQMGKKIEEKTVEGLRKQQNLG